MAVGGGNQGENQNQGQGRHGEYEERVVVDTRPCYVRYSLRGLGVFAGGVCLIFGILNAVFHFLSFWCIVLGIIQAVIGFFVATTEAAGGSVVRVCHCIFLNRAPKCSDWMDRQPLWVKPIIYILVPLPGMIFCTTWWTFFGGGLVLCTGIAYSISLWRQEPPQSQPFNTPANHNTTTSQPSANTMFPKYTVDNHSNQNRTSTSPTIIDIRQNEPTFTTPSKSKSPGGGSSMNPLANLSTSRGSHNNNLDDGGESGWNNGRYENISVISGQTRNTRTPTTAMELGPPEAKNSFYSNVDLEEEDGGGPVGGNPFVPDTNRNKMTIVRNPNQSRSYDNDEDEHNC